MPGVVSVLPASTDTHFLAERLVEAGVVNHYGFEPGPDGVRFGYRVDDQDAVEAVLDAYQTSYLSQALPRKLQAINDIRDQRILGFTFNSLPVQMDLETVANLTAATVGLDRNPDVATIEWSLGAGEFITLDRASIFALADAAFLHVQACFANAKALADAAKAAATVDALDAIDIEAGWPA